MKYKIALFNSFGDDKVIFSSSWLKCKIIIIWLNITGKKAVWMEEIKAKT